MSWNKSAFKNAYNRAKDLRQASKDLEDERDSQWWSDYYVMDDEWEGPNAYDVAIGKLLTILTKLKVKQAQELLDEWYW